MAGHGAGPRQQDYRRNRRPDVQIHGSIPANISEGYSKSSGKDRARSFEYALGSARETVDWYNAVKRVVGDEVVVERLKVLGDVRRLPVAIIPRERVLTIQPRNFRQKPQNGPSRG